jgi:hypothetical protein
MGLGSELLEVDDSGKRRIRAAAFAVISTGKAPRAVRVGLKPNVHLRLVIDNHSSAATANRHVGVSARGRRVKDHRKLSRSLRFAAIFRLVKAATQWTASVLVNPAQRRPPPLPHDQMIPTWPWWI